MEEERSGLFPARLIGEKHMISISLCMIVKNEEDVLERCLKSVGDAADEIIVVDTGSADATKEIALRLGAKVFDFPWTDDFAAARNYSFAQAACDYLLWLDADDVLPENTRRGLLLLKEELDPEVDMVLLPYHTAFDAAGRPTLTFYRERLLRRARGFRWEGEVHEIIPPAGKRVSLPLPVEHRKLKAPESGRNLRIYEGLLRKGKIFTPREQLYYARELSFSGRSAEAAIWLERFLTERGGWLADNIRACLDLAACRERLGDTDGALEAVFRSFVYDAPRAEACCAAGGVLLRLGEYARASYWYELALTRPVPAEGLGFSSPDSAGFLPLLQLCVCADRLGDREKALDYHRRAKALKPEDPAVQYNEQYFNSLSAPCNGEPEPV